MGRKGQSITLSISTRDKAALESLALELGMQWGKRPNISKLVEAIARNELRVAPNHDWSQQRIQALERARTALIDAGQLEQAQQIAQLLLERSELSEPLRAQIERFLEVPQPAWRQKLEHCIQRQQPFRLTYRDATERLWYYTVLFARIAPIERREYLLCRCAESEGNEEVEGLQHNWTLRLDRIEEAAVTPLEQPWHGDLERITVAFDLYGRLAFNYEPKPEDTAVGELEGDPPSRRVTRDTFSTFWLFRELAQYLDSCVIISPEAARSRFRARLQALCRHYGL